MLKMKGYDVKVVDLSSHPESFKEAPEFDADVYGITCFSGNLYSTIEIAKELKKAKGNALIVGGGALMTTSPEIVIQNSDIDVAVIGEGEETFPELIEAWKNDDNFSEIPEICFKRGKELLFTQTRPGYVDINSLPMPDYAAFDMERYIPAAGFVPHPSGDILRTFTILSSRSCPFKCHFCSQHLGPTVRLRSAELLVEEIKFAYENFDTRHILFADDVFAVSLERVKAFADLIKKEDLDLVFSGAGRVNFITDEMCGVLKSIGFRQLNFGFESGSDRVLNLMKKNATVSMARKAVRATQKHKMGVRGLFMIGYPGETKEDIRRTVEFIKDENIWTGGFTYATPLPGSELYKMAIEEGFIQDELEYLKSIASLSSLHMNMSEFRTEELIRIQDHATQEILDNYRRKSHAKVIHSKLLDNEQSELSVECPKCSLVFNLAVSNPLFFHSSICPECFEIFFLDPDDVPHLHSKLETARSLIKNNQKIAICPAGQHTLNLCKLVDFGDSLVGFGDNDSKKHNQLLFGKPIKKIEALQEENPDVILIVTPFLKSEIYDQIHRTTRGIDLQVL